MKIVVLSDKKPGHYKQSLGIVQKITECRSEWHEIHYKHKWRDNLLRLFTYQFGGLHLPTSLINSLLRWSLDTPTYDSLLQIQDVDLILSTGSSLAAINLLLGMKHNARTITCRRPSPVGIRHFDLAILPMLSWESAKSRYNVCKTIGVPNPISPDSLNSLGSELRESFNLQDTPIIGILLGGQDRHETITIEDAKQLYTICNSFADRMKVKILLTTSRRTPTDVSEYLRTNISNSKWCALFIEPDTTSELDDPYQAILALSDVLIVSADSFSMVCEAASSGRKVIILTLTQKSNRLPNRYKVYQYLEDSLIAKRCGIKRLQQDIEETLASRCNPSKILSDTDNAVSAILALHNK